MISVSSARAAANRHKNKVIVYRIVSAQIGASLILAVVAFIGSGTNAAYSAVFAGLISATSTFFVGKKILLTEAGSPQEKLVSLYSAQVIKLIYLVVIICAVFFFFDVHFLSFITAYAATILVYWAAMIFPVFGIQLKKHTNK